jgi:hypothetical protein
MVRNWLCSSSNFRSSHYRLESPNYGVTLVWRINLGYQGQIWPLKYSRSRYVKWTWSFCDYAIWLSSSFNLCLCSCLLYGNTPSFSSRPPFPEEGTLPEESAPTDNKAPETTERRDVDEFEDSTERTESNQSPPSTSSKGGDGGKKRKHRRI